MLSVTGEFITHTPVWTVPTRSQSWGPRPSFTSAQADFKPLPTPIHVCSAAPTRRQVCLGTGGGTGRRAPAVSEPLITCVSEVPCEKQVPEVGGISRDHVLCPQLSVRDTHVLYSSLEPRGRGQAARRTSCVPCRGFSQSHFQDGPGSQQARALFFHRRKRS